MNILNMNILTVHGLMLRPRFLLQAQSVLRQLLTEASGNSVTSLSADKCLIPSL